MILNIFKIKNTFFKIFIELFVLNKDKRANLKTKWAKKHLQKYVDIALSEPLKPTGENSNIIWQYWHQGIEDAPEVIKKCFESIKKFEGDKEIRILTFDTIKDWVELPQRYYDLVTTKKMPVALFSDVLRVYLLEKYGGTWIDSTIYLTDNIPSDIFESDFFLYFFPKNVKCFTENRHPCYFINSKVNSANIQAIKRALNAYWSENDFMFNYFMFEYIETILKENSNLQIKNEWDKMPAHDMPRSLLRVKLYEKYDKEKWNKITEDAYIHKLSYKKFKDQKVDDAEDNFLKHL